MNTPNMNHTIKNNYVLVTPCKNEEINLLNLFNSLSTQTIVPTLWVIVDDGSSDSTPELIKQIVNKCQWVLSFRLDSTDSTKSDTGKHVYSVYNQGFKYLIEYCNKNNIDYNYIGNIDADMILREFNYFQVMAQVFEENQNIGVMSSTVYSIYKNRLIIESNKENLPMGSPRIWRKKCFDETGGYPLGYSADSISNVIVKQQGWDLLTLKEIAAIQARRTSSAGGLWNGYIIHGKSAYYRNYSFLFVVLKSFKLCFIYPYYTGIAYFYGFVLSFICGDEKIEDIRILNYYRHDKFKETLNFYMNVFRQKVHAFVEVFYHKK